MFRKYCDLHRRVSGPILVTMKPNGPVIADALALLGKEGKRKYKSIAGLRTLMEQRRAAVLVARRPWYPPDLPVGDNSADLETAGVLVAVQAEVCTEDIYHDFDGEAFDGLKVCEIEDIAAREIHVDEGIQEALIRALINMQRRMEFDRIRAVVLRTHDEVLAALCRCGFEEYRTSDEYQSMVYDPQSM